MTSPGPQGTSGGGSGGGGNVTGDLNTAGAVHVNGLGGKLGGKSKPKPAAKPVVRKPLSSSTSTTRKGKR